MKEILDGICLIILLLLLIPTIISYYVDWTKKKVEFDVMIWVDINFHLYMDKDKKEIHIIRIR